MQSSTLGLPPGQIHIIAVSSLLLKCLDRGTFQQCLGGESTSSSSSNLAELARSEFAWLLVKPFNTLIGGGKKTSQLAEAHAEHH